MNTRPTTPPNTLLLVHGAGSGPRIFERWGAAFPGITVAAIDLLAELHVNQASMTGYAAVLTAAAGRVEHPVALCGWSMGGLVVLHASLAIHPHSVILLEPSPPAEIQGFFPETSLIMGAFHPEEIYGPGSAGERPRPESLLTRSERKRGISIPRIPCPSLVIYGDSLPPDSGPRVADFYGSEAAHFAGFSHWDLIIRAEVRAAIARFLSVLAATDDGNPARRNPGGGDHAGDGRGRRSD